MAAAAVTREENAFRRVFRFYRRWEGPLPTGLIDFSRPAAAREEKCQSFEPFLLPQQPLDQSYLEERIPLALIPEFENNFKTPLSKMKNIPPDLYSCLVGFLTLEAVGTIVPLKTYQGSYIMYVKRCSLNCSSLSDQDAYRAGLCPVSQWKAYGLHNYPGFIFIQDPFLPGCQRHWVKQCLKEYTQKPNVCNLDNHMSSKETADLWEKSQHLIRNKCSDKGQPKSLLEKLRWVTLGYHYNWNSKKYSADHYTPFPLDLAFLSKQVAKACGFADFQAEAGILNYYHLDSTLGIHVDESELDHTQPLLSFSFGLSSIFLLGGQKQDDAPMAMFMHSGDVMIMSGFSRLLYHAVPRILPNPEGKPLPSCMELPLQDLPADSVIQPCSEDDWQVCARYLQRSRINVTVRQVLAESQSFPTET